MSKQTVDTTETSTQPAPSGMAVDTVHRPVSRQEMTRGQWIWKEIKRNKVGYFLFIVHNKYSHFSFSSFFSY